MRWLETGARQPVILLHGLPMSPDLWRYLLPLVRDTRCLAWAIKGYGASIPEGRSRDISIARQADYLLGWMEVVGLKQAVLVGYDLGGGVAQITAVRHPVQVRGLVLMNAIAYGAWAVLPVKIVRRLGAGEERLPNWAFEPMMRLFISSNHDKRGCAEESFRELWRHYAASDNAVISFVRQVRLLDTRDKLAIGGRLTAPRCRPR
jgi:pimeloyl-ACP methyl ester carboxylesterase